MDKERFHSVHNGASKSKPRCRSREAPHWEPLLVKRDHAAQALLWEPNALTGSRKDYRSEGKSWTTKYNESKVVLSRPTGLFAYASSLTWACFRVVNGTAWAVDWGSCAQKQARAEIPNTSAVCILVLPARRRVILSKGGAHCLSFLLCWAPHSACHSVLQHVQCLHSTHDFQMFSLKEETSRK